MEQVFIIIAVLVFWIFKGVAGAQRRVPGQDPYESDPLSPDAPRDVVGATRQQTLEGQQRAIEALQRWEEEQGLSAGERDPARSASADLVPAASRTRLGRPAMTSGPTAARHRKEAFADIARMLDSGQPAGRTAAKRSGFQVSLPATPSPGEEAARTARPVADRRPSDAAVRRDAARMLRNPRLLNERRLPGGSINPAHHRSWPESNRFHSPLGPSSIRRSWVTRAPSPDLPGRHLVPPDSGGLHPDVKYCLTRGEPENPVRRVHSMLHGRNGARSIPPAHEPTWVTREARGPATAGLVSPVFGRRVVPCWRPWTFGTFSPS